MSRRLEFTTRGRADLEALPEMQRRLVGGWLESYVDGCPGLGKVPGAERIEGSAAGWSIPIGTWRVLATQGEDTVTVEAVRPTHRQGRYRRAALGRKEMQEVGDGA